MTKFQTFPEAVQELRKPLEQLEQLAKVQAPAEREVEQLNTIRSEIEFRKKYLQRVQEFRAHIEGSINQFIEHLPLNTLTVDQLAQLPEISFSGRNAIEDFENNTQALRQLIQIIGMEDKVFQRIQKKLKRLQSDSPIDPASISVNKSFYTLEQFQTEEVQTESSHTDVAILNKQTTNNKSSSWNFSSKWYKLAVPFLCLGAYFINSTTNTANRTITSTSISQDYQFLSPQLPGDIAIEVPPELYISLDHFIREAQKRNIVLQALGVDEIFTEIQPQLTHLSAEMKLPVITNLLFVDQHTGYSFGIGPAKPEVDSALKFSQKTGSPSFTYDQQGIRFDGKVFVCETQVYGYAVAYTVENTKRLFFLRTELDICSNFQN